MNETYYNLEVYDDQQLNMLQVFVAGRDSISIIEAVKNKDGDLRFNTVSDVFKPQNGQELSTEQTFVAKSADTLVVKQSSKQTLDLMPICSYKYAFDEDSKECKRCEQGLKSYGLQSEVCITCMRAWLLGSNSDFQEAQYEQFCNEGYVFSIVLFALVPILVVTIALVCCCFVTGNGIKGSDHVCQDLELE